jgi:HTH-type transcriptional regulator/antitoxin HigA
MTKTKLVDKIVVSDKKLDWNPDYAIAPGAIIMEHMEVRGWGLEELSKKTFIDPEKLYFVLKGEQTVDPAIALGLEHALGIKAYIWMKIDAQWKEFQQEASFSC